MSDKRDALEGLLRAKQTDRAVTMINRVQDHGEGESFVFAVLTSDDPEQNLIDTVLEAFLKTRRDYRPQHGIWVHSLSHFTEKLWKLRQIGWIKNFNEISFRGANELGDNNCSNRLVEDFGKYAQWDDDPAEFHITSENLGFVDWKYLQKTKLRMEAGKLASEAEFLQLQLRNPEVFHLDYHDKVDTKKLRADLGRLSELGADTSEFQNLEKDLLTKQLRRYESDLVQADGEWRIKGAKDGIGKTKSLLAQL
tara:strand:- start:642 stop:1397 length:756 start_codon:yes stop_codon:yes gene_type:complete